MSIYSIVLKLKRLDIDAMFVERPSLENAHSQCIFKEKRDM
jgi:hypothetical protein